MCSGCLRNGASCERCARRRVDFGADVSAAVGASGVSAPIYLSFAPRSVGSLDDTLRGTFADVNVTIPGGGLPAALLGLISGFFGDHFAEWLGSSS